MAQSGETIIDWARFSQARSRLGANFWRAMGYLRDDGRKAISSIEEAMRNSNTIGIIGPAEMLKVESLHLGALGVAEVAEEIEHDARDCLEQRQPPSLHVENIVRLRRMFEGTVSRFEEEVMPVLARGAAIQATSQNARTAQNQ